MNKEDYIKIKNLIHSIGLNNNLPDAKIREIVESQWEFANIKMREIPWDSLKTEDNLNNTKTNFLFAPIGRMYVGMIQVNRLNRRKNGRSNEHDAG